MNKPSFFHNMFRREIEPEYSFDTQKIKVTLIAKMLALLLWCSGSILLALGMVDAQMNIIARISLVLFGVILICGAYFFINPKNILLKEQNELWGLAKPLREQATKEMEIKKTIRQEVEWCETAFSKCVELQSYYSKTGDERLKKCVARTSNMLSMLSFGILNNAPEVLMPKPSQLWTFEEMEKWKEFITIVKEQCESIERIWQSQIAPAKFVEPIFNYDKSWEEDIVKYGEERGIKSMIGAYIAGVPIEDIIV